MVEVFFAIAFTDLNGDGKPGNLTLTSFDKSFNSRILVAVYVLIMKIAEDIE